MTDTQIHILLIEDNPGDARMIELMLADTQGLLFELTWAQTLTIGIEKLCAKHVDVVLLDLGLPESKGLETLQRLFAHAPKVPTLVVLSGLADESVAFQAVQTGAQDYLVKGQTDSALLIRSIRYAIERSQAEEALREARRIAEEASRAKSEFLANMSHELRSPLNIMLGFARMMARHPALPSEVRDDMQIVLRSGEHLHTLINQVLDLSKIEAGRMLLNETCFDLDRLLDELKHMFSIRAGDKGLQLEVARAPAVARHIRTDQVKLRQVLINLLGNAVKFTRKGSVTLQVKPHGPPHEGRKLVFSVTDTGPGIATEEQQRLFGAFMQASVGLQMQEGSGLGLTISRNFVRLMGGEMHIASQPGAGTTVSFDIPVQVVDADAVSVRENRPQMVAALAPGQPRYRVLVVDDRSEARQLLLRLLAPVGFELCEACNGQEAVEIWQSWRPHLIWMDIRMPVLGGREATRRIKAEPDGKNTVIIALTATGFEEERNDIMAAGCDDFLSKPFEEAQIFSLMQKHLSARFVYREDSLPAPEQHAPPDAAALAVLPDALRTALKHALIQLDPVVVSAVIAQIRARDSGLADALQAQADEFQYERILRALQDGDTEVEGEEQT